MPCEDTLRIRASLHPEAARMRAGKRTRRRSSRGRWLLQVGAKPLMWMRVVDQSVLGPNHRSVLDAVVGAWRGRGSISGQGRTGPARAAAVQAAFRNMYDAEAARS
jgi:hypothetical protein